MGGYQRGDEGVNSAPVRVYEAKREAILEWQRALGLGLAAELKVAQERIAKLEAVE